MKLTFKNRFTYLKKYSGSTLIELVVGLSILGVCLSFTTAPFISIFERHILISEVRNLWCEATTAIRRMDAEIKDAQTVQIVSSSSLKITKSHPGSDGYQQVSFYLDDSKLYRKGEPSGTPKILAEKISAFTVSGQNPVVIQLVMTDSSGNLHTISCNSTPMNLASTTKKTFYNSSIGKGDWEPIAQW